MPNNDIDTVNILDFDAVQDLHDTNKRVPAQQMPSMKIGGKPTPKRAVEKAKPTSEVQQSPEKKMNQLRQ